MATMDQDGDHDNIAAPHWARMIDAVWTDEEYDSHWRLSSRDQGRGREDLSWLHDAEGPLAEWLKLFVRKHGKQWAHDGLMLQWFCHKLRANNPSLTRLDLYLIGRSLCDVDTIQLVALSLRNSTFLTSVNLQTRGLGPEAMQSLAEGLKQCKSLQTLIMERNFIGDEGVKAICDLLLANNQVPIKKLDLYKNQITCSGTKYLAHVLKNSDCTLRDLDLTSNKIRDEGATAMSSAIKRNTGLTSLSLLWNKISNKKQRELLEALPHNFNLEQLHFRSDDGEQQSKEIFLKRKWFHSLNKAGRRLLRQNSVPLGIWPWVLAKRSTQPTVIHYFLCENPSLVTNTYACE